MATSTSTTSPIIRQERFKAEPAPLLSTKKIDDHSNVRVIAAKDVKIGQKIDQHSQAEITAGGSVSIGQKIDQHSFGLIRAERGNVDIGQKIDQHSWARISAPNGSLKIGQGVDQHSHLHYQAKSSTIPTIDNGSTADGDMTVGWDPHESRPDS
jgi:hypothetical protein